MNAQTFFYNKIAPTSKVLVLGGGTGWWLKKFFENRPECSMVYIELSPKMLEMSKRALENDKRVTFKHGSEDLVIEVNEFDAVITACFFDLFSDNELSKIVSKIKTSVKPNGLWLATDFIENKWWHSILLFVMYSFFRITTGLQNQNLPDWRMILAQENIHEQGKELFYGDFIKTAFYQVNK